MLKNRFQAAATLDEFIADARVNQSLWTRIYRRARASAEMIAAVHRLPSKRHLLVLSEDWCGDSVNTIPFLARLAEEAPDKLELRVIRRDANDDLMAAHLTNGTRSIPVVIVLDGCYRELGWWGPRPRELQKWLAEEGRLLDHGERYKQTRTWYVRDRGRSTIAEVLAIAATHSVCEAA